MTHHVNCECPETNMETYTVEECCDFEEELLDLADEAWWEVLKEKMKEEIRAKHPDKISELARLVTEANGAKWHHKMAGKKKCKEFKEAIQHFFMSKE